MACLTSVGIGQLHMCGRGNHLDDQDYARILFLQFHDLKLQWSVFLRNIVRTPPPAGARSAGKLALQGEAD